MAGECLPGPAPSAAERPWTQSLLPVNGRIATPWSVGVMELGALICTAARPRCADCPVAGDCAWLARGRPQAARRRAAPGYQGSDRQCRGSLLAVLRAASGPVPAAALNAAWPDRDQRSRALAALIHDGLVARCADGSLALPGDG